MAGSGTVHLRPAEAARVLDVEHLVVEFPTSRGRVHAVSDISFDLVSGETLGIVGESGCGKSTVGRAILRLPPPTSGRVRLHGTDLGLVGGDALRSLRQQLQMVFQDAPSALNPRRTIREIVAEPLVVEWLESHRRSVVVRAWERYVPVMLRVWRSRWLRLAAAALLTTLLFGLAIWVAGDATGAVQPDGTRDGGAIEIIGNAVMLASLVGLAPLAATIVVTAAGWLALAVLLPIVALPRSIRIRRGRAAFWAEAETKVRTVLTDVGIDPDLALDRRPHEFSGGQAQRISIARALVVQPAVVICDEPVAALDVSVQAQVLNLLEDLKAKYGIAMIFIAHDLAVVKNISDRVVVMYLGKVCEVAEPDQLFAEPRHPYTRILLSAIPVADPAVDPRAAQAVGGELPSPIVPPSGCRFRTRCPIASDRCSTDEPQLREVGPNQYVACHHPVDIVASARGATSSRQFLAG